MNIQAPILIYILHHNFNRITTQCHGDLNFGLAFIN